MEVGTKCPVLSPRGIAVKLESSIGWTVLPTTGTLGGETLPQKFGINFEPYDRMSFPQTPYIRQIAEIR